jgi:hypothetical protein
MPTKIDGNNGVLQSYDFQALTTGFSYTFATGTTTLIINPAGTLATGTITMPGSPADGMVITIESTQQVTAVTVAANTGQTLVGAASQLIPNQPLSFIYRLSNTTWYPMAGGAGRATAIVSGTAVASTSGTSIDFTGIPSWVERITVMFAGVSTNGTSPLRVQIGSGSVTTSGYLSIGSQVGSASAGSATFTDGFSIGNATTAATTLQGSCTVSFLSSNSWVAQGAFYGTDTTTKFVAGSVSLSGALDRVRVTTQNGTDTFDAGTINILYE